jgi:hypothetical protein
MRIPCPFCGEREACGVRRISATRRCAGRSRAPEAERAFFDRVPARTTRRPHGSFGTTRRLPLVGPGRARHAHAPHRGRGTCPEAGLIRPPSAAAEPAPDRRPRRSRPAGLFRFDGKAYGHGGDTLASALIPTAFASSAARSSTTAPRASSPRPGGAERARRAAHRRRARAEQQGDGDRALRRSRSGEPEPLALAPLRLDGTNQLFSPLLVGGFYYKTFMWPAPLWEKLYEPMIRRAAGLGRASGCRIRTATRARPPTATCS